MPRLSQDSVLPTAITNIRLGSALRDCGSTGIADAFDKSDKTLLFVYDDRELGCTDWTDLEPDFKAKCFKAVNPDRSIIALLPLDGKIITGTNVVKGGVCDAMLLSEKEMSLIEFKTNVSSTNYQTIIQRANEAVAQIWHTYAFIICPRCILQSKECEVSTN